MAGLRLCVIALMTGCATPCVERRRSVNAGPQAVASCWADVQALEGVRVSYTEIPETKSYTIL